MSRLRRTSKSQHSTLNELNITPLLDLAFVLLVIFIITTPQLVNNLEMNLPSARKPSPSPKEKTPKINKIAVDGKGRLFLNDQPVSIPMLKQDLQQLKALDPDLRIVVRGSDESEYQNMINVLDVLQLLDITKVGLATSERTPPDPP